MVAASLVLIGGTLVGIPILLAPFFFFRPISNRSREVIDLKRATHGDVLQDRQWLVRVRYLLVICVIASRIPIKARSSCTRKGFWRQSVGKHRLRVPCLCELPGLAMTTSLLPNRVAPFSARWFCQCDCVLCIRDFTETSL